MSDSWWQLGEWSGHFGDTLALYNITCAFCGESGNFSREHHAEKKKPNSSKVLNFDTYKCGNCSGYVMVFWSASEHGSSRGLHDYHVLPWPLSFQDAPKHWPKEIQRFWLQAKRNLIGENWDAAAVMARSALQFALRDHKAKKGTLHSEIEDLATKGILPPLMKEWSLEVKELGNESAHPEPGQDEVSPEDARDVVKFLDFLLEYLYDLPKQIIDYRKRNDPDKEEASPEQ
jgi:hypothetical protein